MKYCLLLICILSTAAASAQFPFNFYAQAGANYSTIRIPRTTGIESSNGGFGEQIGIGTEYHTSYGYFVYMGLDFRKESYSKDSLSKYYQDTVTKFMYHPVFAGFPIGLGWQFALSKKLNLKVYGGLNMQVGISGKIKKHNLYYVYDSSLQQPVLTHTESTEHDMRFGRSSRKKYTYDYANTNWGMHIGAGINLNKSFELAVFYYHGFTNFLPNRDAAEEINKLSFFEVNARIYLPNAYFGNKKHNDFW